jgi:hypothetical protein
MSVDGGSFYWIADTHRWVNLWSEDGRWVTEARLSDLHHPQPARAVSFDGLRIQPRLLGVLRDDRVPTTWWYDAGKTDRVNFTAFSVNHMNYPGYG